MKINFVWQGSSDSEVFSHWNDGLRAAMRLIEQRHEVSYREPWDDLMGDIILYWEAPCTVNGKNAEHYRKVQSSSIRKALLFAGGPMKPDGLIGFDHIFVESKINAEELDMLDYPHSTAFGINENIFFPTNEPKKYDAITVGTCASWKRQDLVGKALGPRALIVGRNQDTDPAPFIEARKFGAQVIDDERSYEDVARLTNQARCAVNAADRWGGGQRATLEAMACGLPVVCMEDSPKNREYVEESGFGIVVPPDVSHIQKAVNEAITWRSDAGPEYVKSKWTSRHYADALLDWIEG